MADQRKEAMLLLNDDPVRLPAHLIPAQTVKGTVGGAAVGGGIVAVLMTILQGQPQIIAQIANWGPGLLIVGGFLWLANTYAPSMVASQQSQARELGRLASAIEQSLNRDEDVRDAVRTLAAKLDRHQEIVLQHIGKQEGKQ